MHKAEHVIRVSWPLRPRRYEARVPEPSHRPHSADFETPSGMESYEVEGIPDGALVVFSRPDL